MLRLPPLQGTHRSLSPRTLSFHTSYDAAGAVTKMQLGNGLWETAEYNERLQVKKIGLGTLDSNANQLELDFGYTGSDPTNNVGDRNNGSLRSQTIKVPSVGSNAAFNAVQTYTYDSLNRIHDATESVSSTQTWKQTFSYDIYGNRSFDTVNNNTTTIPTGCSTAVCNPSFSNTRNQITSTGYEYNEDGDLKRDATGQRFHYDSEDRQDQFFIASNSGSTPDATYYYNGEGQRVKKISATETTVFVYDASGLLVAEYSTSSATKPQVSYLTQDHLGSPRIITDQNGAVTSRKDFTAFGETVTSSQRTSGTGGNGYDAPNVRQDYTGYQGDSESGLEYSMARYYNAGHGRFTSPDPMTASATIRDPQSLNRYSYVLNSPYKFADPLGLIPFNMSPCAHRCVEVPASGWWSENGTYQPSLQPASEQIEHETLHSAEASSGSQSVANPAPPPPQPTAEQNEHSSSGPDPSGDEPAEARSATITIGDRTIEGKSDTFNNITFDLDLNKLTDSERNDLFDNHKSFNVSVELYYAKGGYTPLDTEFTEDKEVGRTATPDRPGKMAIFRRRNDNTSSVDEGLNSNLRPENEGGVSFSPSGIKTFTASFKGSFSDAVQAHPNTLKLTVVSKRENEYGLQRQRIGIRINVTPLKAKS